MRGYDRMSDPADDRCDFCGAKDTGNRGWEPEGCTGECGRNFRDPDAERDSKMEDA